MPFYIVQIVKDIGGICQVKKHRNHIQVNLSDADFENLQAKLDKYEMTFSEYFKFVLGYPEKYTIRYILHKGREHYNIGELFYIADLLPTDIDPQVYRNLCRRFYSYVRSHDCGFALSNDSFTTV